MHPDGIIVGFICVYIYYPCALKLIQNQKISYKNISFKKHPSFVHKLQTYPIEDPSLHCISIPTLSTAKECATPFLAKPSPQQHHSIIIIIIIKARQVFFCIRCVAKTRNCWSSLPKIIAFCFSEPNFMNVSLSNHHHTSKRQVWAICGFIFYVLSPRIAIN